MARRGPFLLFNVSQPTGAPVKHVIITIGENRSFDHISATPNGTPAPGQVLHSNRRPAAVGRGLCLDFVAKVEKSEGTKTPITTSKGSHIIAGLLRKCQCRCIRRPIGDRRISATFGLWFSEVATQVCGAPARASPRSNRCHTRADQNPPDTPTACRAARRRGPSPNSAYPGDQSSCPHCGAGCSSLRRAETTLSQGATRTIKSCANH
jgi:hypothetical protein